MEHGGWTMKQEKEAEGLKGARPGDLYHSRPWPERAMQRHSGQLPVLEGVLLKEERQAVLRDTGLGIKK